MVKKISKKVNFRQTFSCVRYLFLVLATNTVVIINAMESLTMSSEVSSQLHSAVEKNDSKTVKLLLQNGAFVNVHDEKNCTPLHRAVVNENSEIIALLLASRADVNAVNNDGQTALHWAVEMGNRRNVELLLSNGADANAADKKGNTPLILLASSRKHSSEIAQLLIDKNAQINAAAKHGNTALHMAALVGHVKIVRLLLECGADTKMCNRSGETPLDLAKRAQMNQVVELFHDYSKGSLVRSVSRDADNQRSNQLRAQSPKKLSSRASITHEQRNVNSASPWSKFSDNNQIFEHLRAQGADLSRVNKDGFTLLHWAADKGFTALIERLLENGAVVDAKCSNGDTPLHRAAWEGNKEAAELLLQNGALVDCENVCKETPLHGAARGGHLPVVKLLLAYGASHTIKGKHGCSAQYLAAQNGYVEVVELLLTYHWIDFKALKKFGFKPRYLSVNCKTASLLIAHGASVHERDEDGMTALHWASRKGDSDIIFLLLSKGADIRARDKMGMTALHWAATKGHAEVVEALLTRGADATDLNNKGMTPLQCVPDGSHFNEIRTMFLRVKTHGIDQALTDLENEIMGNNNNEGNIYSKAPLLSDNSSEEGELEEEALDAWLTTGAQLEARDEFGETALIRAARFGRLEAVRSLLAKGAAIDAASLRGETALYWACSGDRADIAQLLLENGADPNCRYVEGSVLHLAVMQNNLALAKMFLENGADSNALGVGLTPLHLATAANDVQMVELLLTHGCDTWIKCAGQTALECAVEVKHKEIVELLLRESSCFICRCKLDRSHGDLVHVSAQCHCLMHGPCREALFEDRGFDNRCPLCKIEIPKELEECAICLEEFDRDNPGVIGRNCTHRLHAHCQRAQLNLKDECPFCSLPIMGVVNE